MIIRLFILAGLFILPFIMLHALDKTAEASEQSNSYFLCIRDGLPADECHAGVYGN